MSLNTDARALLLNSSTALTEQLCLILFPRKLLSIVNNTEIAGEKRIKRCGEIRLSLGRQNGCETGSSEGGQGGENECHDSEDDGIDEGFSVAAPSYIVQRGRPLHSYGD